MRKYIVTGHGVPAISGKFVNKDGVMVKVTPEKKEIKNDDSGYDRSQVAIYPEGARHLQKGDIFSEVGVKTSEIDEARSADDADMRFIEEYEAYKLTDSDIKAHPHLKVHHGKDVGSEIHKSPKHDVYRYAERHKPTGVEAENAELKNTLAELIALSKRQAEQIDALIAKK